MTLDYLSLHVDRMVVRRTQTDTANAVIHVDPVKSSHGFPSRSLYFL